MQDRMCFGLGLPMLKLLFIWLVGCTCFFGLALVVEMQLDQVAEAAGLDGRICGRRQSSLICRGSSVNSEDCASRTGSCP